MTIRAPSSFFPQLIRACGVVLVIAAGLGPTGFLHGQDTGGATRERVLIGCVERESGTADLLLTHAAAEPPAGRNAVGIHPKSGEVYRLAAPGDPELVKLIGHRVRVSGVLEKEPPRTGRPSPPTGQIDERRATGQNRLANAPTLRVRTARSLAGKCPGPSDTKKFP